MIQKLTARPVAFHFALWPLVAALGFQNCGGFESASLSGSSLGRGLFDDVEFDGDPCKSSRLQSLECLALKVDARQELPVETSDINYIPENGSSYLWTSRAEDGSDLHVLELAEPVSYRPRRIAMNIIRFSVDPANGRGSRSRVMSFRTPFETNLVINRINSFRLFADQSLLLTVTRVDGERVVWFSQDGGIGWSTAALPTNPEPLRYFFGEVDILKRNGQLGVLVAQKERDPNVFLIGGQPFVDMRPEDWKFHVFDFSSGTSRVDTTFVLDAQHLLYEPVARSGKGYFQGGLFYSVSGQTVTIEKMGQAPRACPIPASLTCADPFTCQVQFLDRGPAHRLATVTVQEIVTVDGQPQIRTVDTKLIRFTPDCASAEVFASAPVGPGAPVAFVVDANRIGVRRRSTPPLDGVSSSSSLQEIFQIYDLNSGTATDIRLGDHGRTAFAEGDLTFTWPDAHAVVGHLFVGSFTATYLSRTPSGLRESGYRSATRVWNMVTQDFENTLESTARLADWPMSVTHGLDAGDIQLVSGVFTHPMDENRKYKIAAFKNGEITDLGETSQSVIFGEGTNSVCYAFGPQRYFVPGQIRRPGAYERRDKSLNSIRRVSGDFLNAMESWSASDGVLDCDRDTMYRLPQGGTEAIRVVNFSTSQTSEIPYPAKTLTDSLFRTQLFWVDRATGQLRLFRLFDSSGEFEVLSWDGSSWAASQGQLPAKPTGFEDREALTYSVQRFENRVLGIVGYAKGSGATYTRYSVPLEIDLNTMSAYLYLLPPAQFDHVGSGFIAHGFGLPFGDTNQFSIFDGSKGFFGPLAGVVECIARGGTCTIVPARQAVAPLTARPLSDGSLQALFIASGLPQLTRVRPK